MLLRSTLVKGKKNTVLFYQSRGWNPQVGKETIAFKVFNQSFVSTGRERTLYLNIQRNQREEKFEKKNDKKIINKVFFLTKIWEHFVEIPLYTKFQVISRSSHSLRNNSIPS